MIMKVRALVDCFVGGVRRKAGTTFELPEGLKPSKKGMEVIGDEPESPAKSSRGRRAKAAGDEPETLSQMTTGDEDLAAERKAHAE